MSSATSCVKSIRKENLSRRNLKIELCRILLAAGTVPSSHVTKPHVPRFEFRCISLAEIIPTLKTPTPYLFFISIYLFLSFNVPVSLPSIFFFRPCFVYFLFILYSIHAQSLAKFQLWLQSGHSILFILRCSNVSVRGK